MKIVLFVGEIAPHGMELMESIKQEGFHCIRTQNADEIDQVGKQAQKAILIFTDSKFAFRFLVENNWRDFPHLHILYLPKQPVITADSQKKLSQVSLSIYTPADNKKLLEKMNDFQTNAKEDILGEEIEFSVHQELGKKV